MIDGNFYSTVLSAAIERVLVVATVVVLVIGAAAFGAGYYFGQSNQSPKIETKVRE